MTGEVLDRRLSGNEIVVLSREEWEGLADRFETIEVHDTGLAGQLVLARGEVGLVIVEEPEPNERVLRRLATESEAHRFIRDRLAAYDRMWDGCGCKIDYRV